MAWMWLGVRPIIRLASDPTASGRPSFTLTATTDGSLSTMPRPRTYTKVLAVPRSMAMSRPIRDEKKLSDTREGLQGGGLGQATGALAAPPAQARSGQIREEDRDF